MPAVGRRKTARVASFCQELRRSRGIISRTRENPGWIERRSFLHNIEAAHGDAMISHGGSQRVHLVLAPPEERAPTLQEYVRVASSGRKHFPIAGRFAAIAAQYPVYRIEVPAA
jgi:hypothetical protein